MSPCWIPSSETSVCRILLILTRCMDQSLDTSAFRSGMGQFLKLWRTVHAGSKSLQSRQVTEPVCCDASLPEAQKIAVFHGHVEGASACDTRRHSQQPPHQQQSPPFVSAGAAFPSPLLRQMVADQRILSERSPVHPGHHVLPNTSGQVRHLVRPRSDRAFGRSPHLHSRSLPHVPQPPSPALLPKSAPVGDQELWQLYTNMNSGNLSAGLGTSGLHQDCVSVQRQQGGPSTACAKAGHAGDGGPVCCSPQGACQ